MNTQNIDLQNLLNIYQLELYIRCLSKLILFYSLLFLVPPIKRFI